MLGALVRREAEAARDACEQLDDERVGQALHAMGTRIEQERDAVLAGNERDVAAAAGRLDEGALDRLRLDPGRLDDVARQVAAVAALPPLERTIEEWTLQNGLQVSARRIPIGVVGA